MERSNNTYSKQMNADEFYMCPNKLAITTSFCVLMSLKRFVFQKRIYSAINGNVRLTIDFFLTFGIFNPFGKQMEAVSHTHTKCYS